jgi:hypothetical protein
MIGEGQRFQIARRFEFGDQGAALRFVRRMADLRRDLGGEYELDLTGNTLTVRIAAAPLQAESSATIMRRLECWYYG